MVLIAERRPAELVFIWAETDKTAYGSSLILLIGFFDYIVKRHWVQNWRKFTESQHQIDLFACVSYKLLKLFLIIMCVESYND